MDPAATGTYEPVLGPRCAGSAIWQEGPHRCAVPEQDVALQRAPATVPLQVISSKRDQCLRLVVLYKFEGVCETHVILTPDACGSGAPNCTVTPLPRDWLDPFGNSKKLMFLVLTMMLAHFTTFHVQFSVKSGRRPKAAQVAPMGCQRTANGAQGPPPKGAKSRAKGNQGDKAEFIKHVLFRENTQWVVHSKGIESIIHKLEK